MSSPPEEGDEDPSGSSTIDTALLESLFYNEMMLIDDTSSLLSSSLFASLSAEFGASSTTSSTTASASASASAPRSASASVTATAGGQQRAVSLSHIDPTTIAEKALLRHFGVTGDTAIPPEDEPQAVVPPVPPSLPPPAAPQLHPSAHASTQPGMTHPAWGAPGGRNPRSPPAAPPAAVGGIALAGVEPSLPMGSPYGGAAGPPPPGGSPRPPGTAAAAGTVGPHEKLVSQFATLAQRLGIRVPPHLLQALLNNGGASNSSSNNSSMNINDISALLTTAAAATSSASAEPPSPGALTARDGAPGTATAAAVAIPAPPPAVKELEDVARAAIAAVSESTTTTATTTFATKRRHSDGDNSEPGDPSPAGAGSAAAASAASSKAPAYSKRRKKPRLADCETKLAQLQAENDLLKRHLTTISNQSNKIDAERKDLEKKMRTMLVETSATPQEMDQLVQTFSDYYSDYGRRRHQELEFHLEQLQRLANPTNFTKMGLWTLGQQSSNPRKDPIASILQKELGITPQQGKKIIEQRQKIRDVCTNLSECLALLSKLKGLCEQKTQIFNNRMEKCREILSPRQVIKLLIWIDENSSVLEKVCPGWGSEQIPTKPKKGGG